ncbi:sensor histidine kinase [Erythrobacter sp. R86502]|uniref:sensor histidine kinase n=1 Tax=Erythrobacter sp. R86502 TaxID=3093846 RepID=UPI0036D389D5
MKALSRFSLAQQVMLIVAAGLILAQALNFGLLLRERQAFRLENAAVPAISRLIDNLEAVDWGAPIDPRKFRRTRVRVSANSPIGPDAIRLENVEERVVARMMPGTRRMVRDVRAAMMPGPRGNRNVVVSVQLDSGQWLTARSRGPAPIGPAIAMLAVQTLVILAAILVPLLLLVRSVTRPLASLTHDAENWVAEGWNTDEPVRTNRKSGPRDVRDLITAVDDMKARITQMLREKDVMLGAIGHDLRTPLTSLRIQVELINDDDQRIGMIEEIDRLSDDLENILSLARSSTIIERAPSDLTAIAQALVADFKAKGEKAEVRPGPALIASVDAAAIRRAMANLIDNAVRYGGAARIRLEKHGEIATIVVEDDGPGIPDALLTAATEAFVRIETSRNRVTGGYGLGLAIVGAIVRAHGGKLSLSNRSEGGLRANLSFPIA